MSILRASWLAVLLVACISSPSVSAQEPVRTADITMRGLTAADFPRITRLAANVFAYEQIDPTKRTVTANNLIVVTADGVLVADGQGMVANTTRLVQDIARLTPQPIRYVVVGSEHGTIEAEIPRFPGRRPSSCIPSRRPPSDARPRPRRHGRARRPSSCRLRR